MVDHFTNKGLKVTGLWEQVEIPLLIFQSAAVFEVNYFFDLLSQSY
jgi:hypothetical protein